MQKEIILDTNDEHKIYGTLCAPSEKTDKLVIFVHGFTSSCNDHIFFNGSKFLKSKGIASYRFDLYSWQNGARSMIDCGTSTHVEDLKTVYDHFKDEYSKIYLVGHSWGGVVVLESKLDAAGIILWDSSHPDFSFEENEYQFNEALDAYLLHWGMVYVVGKKMHDETVKIKPATELIAGNNSPIKIICAGDGILINGGKEYYALAKEPKALAIIENATHCFDEEESEIRLFEETVDWINKT